MANHELWNQAHQALHKAREMGDRFGLADSAAAWYALAAMYGALGMTESADKCRAAAERSPSLIVHIVRAQS